MAFYELLIQSLKCFNNPNYISLEIGLLFLHFVSPKKCHWFAAAYFLYQDMTSNEFCSPVTSYFVVFQNWWKVFTAKKYYLLKVVFFCLEVVLLLMLHATSRISKGQGPCRARKPRRSSGWWFPACCPPARCAAGEKAMITFSRLQITCCLLPEAFTNGITILPVNWINLPATQLMGRLQIYQSNQNIQWDRL